MVWMAVDGSNAVKKGRLGAENTCRKSTSVQSREYHMHEARKWGSLIHSIMLGCPMFGGFT